MPFRTGYKLHLIGRIALVLSLLLFYSLPIRLEPLRTMEVALSHKYKSILQ
jgi:hypothetical protein